MTGENHVRAAVLFRLESAWTSKHRIAVGIALTADCDGAAALDEACLPEWDFLILASIVASRLEPRRDKL